MDSRRAEWRLVLVGIGLVAALAVAQVCGWLLTRERFTPLEKTQRCLELRKDLVTRPTRDPIARSAGGGAFATTIEENDVSVSFPSDEDDARRILSDYHQVGGPLVGQLERRGSGIYLWARPATPTQRQTTYDCAH